ncbi:MAG: ABC transporter permease [Catenulispora sp.]|nr:ABC transporter permease [Catenulispora sp.]
MFFLIYLRRELLRRKRQTIVGALGLAVGIGLVLTVTMAAAGVKKAQADVLHALYGIGTDITVTAAAPPPPKLGSSEGASQGFSPGQGSQHVDVLGLPPGLGPLDATAVESVSHLPGVSAAAGGLLLRDTQLDVPTVQEQSTPGWRPSQKNLGVTFTVIGVDPGRTSLGPFASAQLSSGRSFVAGDTGDDVAVVDSGYATANGVATGSTVTVAGTKFHVIGIVQQSQGGGAADVYIPLARAQALAAFQGLPSLTGRVDTIYVSADSASHIGAVRNAIAKVLPTATVTSSSSLADAVSGSLAGAASLASNLGRWLAVGSLAAAFAVSSLMTVSAVSRRVREIGTLKALGWNTRRIISQLLGESLVTGLIGAVLGVGIGLGGGLLVRRLAPALSATVAQNPGAKIPENVRIDDTGMHHEAAAGGSHTIAVHLTAPVTLTAIGLAVVLGVGGGLLAGMFGGWRAARLRPATAMTRVA